MNTENIFISLVNYVPETMLFMMSMVILLVGLFKTSKKYVFVLAFFSVFTAFLLSFKYQPDSALLLFNSSLLKNNVTEFFKYLCYLIFLIQIIKVLDLFCPKPK